MVMDMFQPGPPILELVSPCRRGQALVRTAPGALARFGKHSTIDKRVTPHREAVSIVQVLLTIELPCLSSAEPLVAFETQLCKAVICFKSRLVAVVYVSPIVRGSVVDLPTASFIWLQARPVLHDRALPI